MSMYGKGVKLQNLSNLNKRNIKSITPEITKYLTENYNMVTLSELATHCKVSPGKITAWLKELKLERPHKLDSKPKPKKQVIEESEFFKW